MTQATTGVIAPVTVTLTTEEWVSIMGVLLGKGLSDLGSDVLNRAKSKMADQVGAATKQPFNTALEMLKAAQAAGYTFAVECEGEIDYKGTDAAKAWEAVEATTEAHVTLTKPDAKREWCYLIAPGPATVEPSESLVDFVTNGFIDQWWEAHREEILA